MATEFSGQAFIPYYDHLMSILATNDDLRKTAKGMLKQVAWGATGTVAGAVVAGPLGAMVGGVCGSVIGYARSKKYNSLLQVLRELSDEEKEELVMKVQELVGCVGKDALTGFVCTKAHRSALIDLLISFRKKIK